MGSERLLAEVADEVRACTRCPLAHRRTLAVPGEGNPLSDVLLVGEGPGAREDATGRPFVGPAGRLLDELLTSIGWAREDVFIANVVKCRPPGNRDPEPDEIAACGTFLDRQQAALEPLVIVTLGRFSLRRYLPGSRIGAVHGQVHRDGLRVIYPLYHPAAGLRDSGVERILRNDFQKLPHVLLDARKAVASAIDITPSEDQLRTGFQYRR